MSFDRVAFAVRMTDAVQAAAKRGEEAFGYEARPDGSFTLRTRPKRRRRAAPAVVDDQPRSSRGVIPRPRQESLF